MPISKLAGDLAEKHFAIELKKNSFFHGLSDMVDAEAITVVLMKKVNFITFDNPDNIRQRIKFTRKTLKEIEDRLGVRLLPIERFCSVYCLKRPVNKEEKIAFVEVVNPGDKKKEKGVS